ncbi:MAG: hypothetical protein ABIP51_20120 [Bacteroidia bacterium]
MKNIKVSDKVTLKNIPKEWVGWGFENSTVTKIWIGSITHKTYCSITSEQGHSITQIEIWLPFSLIGKSFKGIFYYNNQKGKKTEKEIFNNGKNY